MKKRNIILGLSLCGVLISTLCYFNFANKNVGESNLVSNVKETNGIKINSIKYNQAQSYGSQTINFTVEPSVNTDDINYSLTYASDNSVVESNIFDVILKVDRLVATITCLKPFNSQVIFTLYSINNENIKASITIDFKEKVKLDPVLIVNEGSPLSINENLTSTGGSILIDKTIKNAKITWNSDFVSSSKTKMRNRFLETNFTSPEIVDYQEVNSSYTGFDDATCNYFFTNEFSYATFLQSLYYHCTYTAQDIDSEYESTWEDTIYFTDLLRSDFSTIFNGETPIFTYTFTINNIAYSYDFGLLIDKVNIHTITIHSSGLIF